MLKLPLRQMLRIRDLKIAEARNEIIKKQTKFECEPAKR
jgi:hypothetical protein